MRLKADDVVARELVGEITNSLYWFDKEVLGYDLVPHAHYDLCEFVDGRYTDTKDYVPGSNQGQLILMPRNSYKTSVVTIGHCLQQMSLNPNIRILLINEVLDTATGFLEEIKGHIETNEKFQAFNGFLQGGDIWTKDKITISTRTVRKKEPTLTCAGIGTVKVGNHYDLIILDDLHSHKNVTSTTMIKQVIDTYKLAWSLLDPHGKMVVIGTRWSFFDLYHHITETERHRFDVFKRSAHNPDGSLFFPEVLSERWLADQRKSQSSYIYSCQYENDPVDDENAAFRKEWLAYWHKDSAGQFRPVEKETEYKEGYAPVFYRAEQMYWYMSIDPAIADKTGSDETAMVVTAIDPDDRVFIIYADSFKVSPTGIINKTFDLLDRYPHIRSVGIETTIFQRSIRFAMYKAFKDAQRPMLIEELPTPWTTSKEQRILGLVPRFEFREIFLGKNMHKLEDQLIRFPVGKHDDVLDALAHQQLMWKKPPKDMKRSAPEGSWNYYHNKLKELRASSGEEHWGNMRAKEYKNGTYYA